MKQFLTLLLATAFSSVSLAAAGKQKSYVSTMPSAPCQKSTLQKQLDTEKHTTIDSTKKGAATNAAPPGPVHFIVIL